MSVQDGITLIFEIVCITWVVFGLIAVQRAIKD